MPRLRIGTIPRTRLTTARRVRDQLNVLLGRRGYALVSILNGGYSVCVRLFEGVKCDIIIPSIMDGIPIRVSRTPKKT